MNFGLILLILGIQICVSSSQNENFTNSVEVSPRLQGYMITDKYQYPWLVILLQVSTDTQLGDGAIISKRYAMFTATVVKPVASNPADATVYSNVDQRAYLIGGVAHPVLEILVHPKMSGNKYNVALVKTCPTFSGNTPVALAPQIYDPYPTTTVARIVKYFGLFEGISYLDKNVGLATACRFTFNWDPSLMFCLENNADKNGEIQDINSPVVINSQLAGFLMAVQFRAYGEQVSDVNYFKDWIATIEIL